MLTAEQTAALEARDRSVSLAAGAGCGKTFVLTERYLSYVDPRVLSATADLQELVAITYTDAAAREMRSRIRERCVERRQAATTPEEQQAWQSVLRGLDRARISTIHSFCGDVLRANAVQLGLDPGFEILEPASADLLKLDTLDRHLRWLLSKGDEELIALAARLGLHTLRGVVPGLLGSVHQVAERWFDATPGELLEVWDGYRSTTLQQTLREELLLKPSFEELREIASGGPRGNGPLNERLAEIADVIAAIDSGQSLGEASETLVELARVQGGPAKKSAWDDETDYTRFKNAAAEVRKQAEKALALLTPDDDALEEAAQTGLALMRLAVRVGDEYEAMKQARGQLEFDDLLSHTHRLLHDQAHAAAKKRLQNGIRLLMVDEFQDTAPQQVELVQALCGPDWKQSGLFVVGDYKQSIYRFRGAEPEVSEQLRASLPGPGRLSLTTNFRSQPAVLDFVNRLFEEEFSGYEPLRAFRPQQTDGPCIELLWSSPAAGSADSSTAAERAAEARWMARRVAELIASERPIVAEPHAGAPRAARPGDVAVLMRSLSDAPVYEAALREAGLDYYLAGGHTFYAQQEVFDVLNLLRSVDSLTDEVSLAGVLRSPFFSLEDETLFWLVESRGSLSRAVGEASPPTQLSAVEADNFTRAAAVLADLRLAKERLSVAGLLDRALSQTGYDAALLSEFLGERKLANLDKLREQARQADRLRPGDLPWFIRQLQEFVDRPPKEALAATTTEGDSVRVMTIHHAKGLEFPVVVVPDLGRGNRLGATRPVFDAELGPLVSAKRKGAKTPLDWLRKRGQQLEREERVRLMYVACTRAADYLILSASASAAEKASSEWLSLLAKRFDLFQGQGAPGAEMGGPVPKITVTTAEPPRSGAARPESRASLRKAVDTALQSKKTRHGDPAAPVAVDPNARRRFSFSLLSGALVDKADEPKLADPPRSNGVDPLALGQLVHGVLERIDYRRPDLHQSLCEELAPLFTSGAPGQLAAEATQLVGRFAESELWKSLAAADVHREVEFLLPWPGKPGSKQYLHGFVDCLYRDPNGLWRIVDFKTNRVGAGGIAEASLPYHLQMAVYAEACRRALGTAPAGCTLYFLRAGEGFDVPPEALSIDAALPTLNAARDQLASEGR
ncbi:MAG: UvrD-helicase domain-containing protein [Planctomycetota bacterium]